MPDHSGMDKFNTLPPGPLPLNKAARCLGVPARWLRDEVLASRVPGLRAGRVILIHTPTVAKLLAERAQHHEAAGVAS